jgi:hypothetical protein
VPFGLLALGQVARKKALHDYPATMYGYVGADDRLVRRPRHRGAVLPRNPATLDGARTGQHSIRINGQWRIVFRWIESHAHDVAVVDYH